ncbi:HK97 family phage prohead protease [Sphingomonas silueang]|uniref:HK97 family phage prohead protease n=1 Tax=Sphingomonas silueang TaxID=3156617 RepID=UPI0032B341CE
MITKNLTIQSVDDAGVGLARIAQLSAVDNDGDTYLPGAFSWKEQWVYILPAHNRSAMPLGKARVYEEGDWALAELRLNLNTQAGRDWHETLKFDLATGTPVQEWSYGFDVLDASPQFRQNMRVRELKKLAVNEVSTVLRGAGIGTGTLQIKGATLRPERFAALVGELAVIAATDPAVLSASGRKQLRDIHGSIGETLAAIDRPAPSSDDAVGAWLHAMSRRHLSA